MFYNSVVKHDPCGEITPFSLPLNQQYIFTAKVNTCPDGTGTVERNILVVQTANSGVNNTIQFVGGAAVVAPMITYIVAIVRCNQINPYTFIDLDTNYASLAVNGMVQFVQFPESPTSEGLLERLITGLAPTNNEITVVAETERASTLQPVQPARGTRG